MSRQSRAEIERKGQRSNKGAALLSKLLGRRPTVDDEDDEDDE